MRRMTSLLAACAMALASRATGPPATRYPSPIELAITPDGSRLYALCDGTDEVVTYDLRSGTILRRIRVGRVPKGMTLASNGKRLYVANSWSDNVSEVDTTSLEVVRTLPAGFEPNAVITDRAQRLFRSEPNRWP